MIAAGILFLSHIHHKSFKKGKVELSQYMPENLATRPLFKNQRGTTFLCQISARSRYLDPRVRFKILSQILLATLSKFANLTLQVLNIKSKACGSISTQPISSKVGWIVFVLACSSRDFSILNQATLQKFPSSVFEPCPLKILPTNASKVHLEWHFFGTKSELTGSFSTEKKQMCFWDTVLPKTRNSGFLTVFHCLKKLRFQNRDIHWPTPFSKSTIGRHASWQIKK